MVGLAFNKRTTDGMMQTKWSVDSINNLGEKHFPELFSIAGRELDYIDWVDAMNRCADWALTSQSTILWGQFYLGTLVNMLSSASDFIECEKCGHSHKR